MIRLLFKLLILALVVLGGYFVYTEYIREDPCNPPADAPATWEPSIECLESRGTVRYQP